MSRRLLARASLLVLTLFAACDTDPSDPGDLRRSDAALAPLVSGGPDAIPGRYIVVFRNGVADVRGTAEQLAAANGGQVVYSYESALRGFAVNLPAGAVDALRRNPNIAYIQEDAMMEMDTDQASPPSWGLDRIDQRNLPLNSVYSYTPTGAGVRAYIIDSGIRTTHLDFGGRASIGLDLTADGFAGGDCNGHGTHVAGTVGGNLVGVAKAVQLIGVRVFSCSGGAPNSRIIAAIDWVTANGVKPAVVNMSLGGSFDMAVNTAVQNSIAAGFVYVLSAGNDDADACGQSPASTPAAITVGSTTQSDTRSPFSNWGNCVDIFAPGSSIFSLWWTSDNAAAVLSGTSMAAPHVAGVAALYLQGSTTATPAQVVNAILGSASLNRLVTTGFGTPPLGMGSPNALLYAPLTSYVRVASLNPSTIDLTFLRTQGMSPSTVTERPVFHPSGMGAQKSAPATADGTMYLTSTASVAEAPVLLRNMGSRDLDWTALTANPWLTVSPAEGQVSAGSTVVLSAELDASLLTPGVHPSVIALYDELDPDVPEVVSVITRVAESIPVHLGVPVSPIGGAVNTRTFYEVHVPVATDLTITVSGGTGDFDLYVRYEGAPSFHEFDCRPFVAGNNESCRITFPPAGTYYIMLHAWALSAGATLTATIGGPPAAPFGLNATAVSGTQVDLAWNDFSVNEARFVVQRNLYVADAPTGWTTIANGPPLANATSYSDVTATPGAEYRYRVRSCNSDGCSAWSVSNFVSTPAAELDPPAAPSGLVKVSVTTSSILLAWTDNSDDETGFDLERRVKTGGSFSAYADVVTTDADDEGHDDTGLDAGTIYQYRVRACNDAGCSAYVTSAQIKTAALPPTAPSGAVAFALSGSSLRITWVDNSNNEVDFQLQRRTRNSDGTVTGYVEVTRPNANAEGYNNTGLTGGTTHQYRIRACNAGGCSAFAATTFVTVPVSPAAPTAVTANAVSSTEVDVDWVDNSNNEVDFQLQRRLRNLDGTFGAYADVIRPAVDVVTFGDTGLLPGRVYQYRIRSCNVAGCSAYAGSGTVTLPN